MTTTPTTTPATTRHQRLQGTSDDKTPTTPTAKSGKLKKINNKRKKINNKRKKKQNTVIKKK